MQLTNKELLNISGGAIKLGIAFAIGSAVALVIGIIDGYLRPLKCR